MTPDKLKILVKDLCSLSQENEWVEFKCNNEKSEDIGEYTSALSNAAALLGKPRGYLIWGIDDATHQIVGTNFRPKQKKIGGQGKNGNQELESWLLDHLNPGLEVYFHEIEINDLTVVVFEIQAAFSHPVRFKNDAFIRVGTYKKKLSDYPEKERKLWERFQMLTFEKGIAKDFLSNEQVFQELDYISYFQLSEQTLPDNRLSIIQRLKSEGVIKEELDRYSITNIGAILFANNLENFGRLGRKILRVVIYQGSSRVNTIKEGSSRK